MKRLYLVQTNQRYGENVYFPYSVGLLWAYAKTFPEVTSNYEMCGFLYLKESIEKAISKLVDPDLIGLSLYVWNEQWSYQFAMQVKKRWPKCEILVGGVSVWDECSTTLERNPYFDYAIYGEGEGAFVDFLKEHQKENPDFTKCGSLLWRSKDDIKINKRIAFTKLEELRSPYLDGIFDVIYTQEKRWQILQETHRGCLAEGTKVTTKHGRKPIEEIKSGEEVLGWNEKLHVPMWNIVNHGSICTGVQSVLDIVIGDYNVKATKDHPFYTGRGWVNTSNLRVGDVVLCYMQRAKEAQRSPHLFKRLWSNIQKTKVIGEQCIKESSEIICEIPTNMYLLWKGIFGYKKKDMLSRMRLCIKKGVAGGEKKKQTNCKLLLQSLWGTYYSLFYRNWVRFKIKTNVFSRVCDISDKAIKTWRQESNEEKGSPRQSKQDYKRGMVGVFQKAAYRITHCRKNPLSGDVQRRKGSSVSSNAIKQPNAAPRSCCQTISNFDFIVFKLGIQTKCIKSQSKHKTSKQIRITSGQIFSRKQFAISFYRRLGFLGWSLSIRKMSKPRFYSHNVKNKKSSFGPWGVLAFKHEGCAGRVVGLSKQRMDLSNNMGLRFIGSNNGEESDRFFWCEVSEINKVIGLVKVYDLVDATPFPNFFANGILVHNCPYQCTFCLTADTLVRTVGTARFYPSEDAPCFQIKWKPITEIREGDYVFDGRDWVETEGVVIRGEQHIGRWYGVGITGNHLVMNQGRWTPAAFLEGWEEQQSFVPVFDLLNCGPLNRFTIKTNIGESIVHNCAWGQAALTKVRPFSEDRIYAEYEWFGQHSADYIDNCIAEGSLVNTSRGMVPIEQVVPNDIVIGWCEDTEEFSLNKVEKSLFKGIENVWEIKHEFGRIEATADHAIFTPNGWRKVSELQIGEYFLCTKKGSRVYWNKITSIEYSGKKKVYDLVNAVPTHNFFANGILVSNCDANYGILKRDTELTQRLVDTKKKYGYPKTFRTSFAKNSNDKIWTIANMLHEAKMLKAVTLAMQSMDQEVLVNIKRKNIKFDHFGDLIKKYEDAGIPTYTELIMGLPGESLTVYEQGIEKNLEAGQHSGLFMYMNIMLPNTEQNNPEYISKHGLKTLSMQAMLTHGTPDSTVISERQDIIVETSVMPHEDWKQAYLYSKTIEIFHSQGLLQKTAVFLHDLHRISYYSFYSNLRCWIDSHPESVIAREFHQVEMVLDTALAGGSWDLVDQRLGDISWPPEEFVFARICLQLDQSYEELKDFFLYHMHGPIDLEWRITCWEEQKEEIIGPEFGKEKEWATQIVWYGRKGYGAKKRGKIVKQDNLN